MPHSLILLLGEAEELLDMDCWVLVTHCQLFDQLQKIHLNLDELSASC